MGFSCLMSQFQICRKGGPLFCIMVILYCLDSQTILSDGSDAIWFATLWMIVETLAISPGLTPESCPPCNAWSHAILAYLWMLSRTGKSLKWNKIWQNTLKYIKWTACKRTTLCGWGDLVSKCFKHPVGFQYPQSSAIVFFRSAGKMKFLNSNVLKVVESDT